MNRRMMFYALLAPLAPVQAFQALAEHMLRRWPMRVSVEPDDPGYVNWQHDKYHYTVYVDDVKAEYCVTADEGQGLAIVHETHPDGRLLIRDFEFVHKTLRGRVRIEVRPRV